MFGLNFTFSIFNKFSALMIALRYFLVGKFFSIVDKIFGLNMNKKIVYVLLLMLAAFSGGWLFAHKPAADNVPAVEHSEASVSATATSNKASVSPTNSSLENMSSKAMASSPVYDPRLANLVASTDNPMINYVRGEGGIVIAEIDNDPNSASYKKPLKEYQYQKDHVRSMTRYEYYKTETVITTTDVAYKNDGSILDYRENTITRKIAQ